MLCLAQSKKAIGGYSHPGIRFSGATHDLRNTQPDMTKRAYKLLFKYALQVMESEPYLPIRDKRSSFIGGSIKEDLQGDAGWGLGYYALTHLHTFREAMRTTSGSISIHIILVKPLVHAGGM